MWVRRYKPAMIISLLNLSFSARVFLPRPKALITVPERKKKQHKTAILGPPCSVWRFFLAEPRLFGSRPRARCPPYTYMQSGVPEHVPQSASSDQWKPLGVGGHYGWGPVLPVRSGCRGARTPGPPNKPRAKGHPCKRGLISSSPRFARDKRRGDYHNYFSFACRC